MKIAFFTDKLWNSGGIERVLTIIANELVRHEEIQVDIIPIMTGTPFFELDSRIGVMPLNSEKISNLYRRYASNIYRLKRILREKNYDYLITAGVQLSLVSIPASAGLRTKNISWEHFNASKGRIPSILARRMVSRSAHQIVTLTEDDKRAYERKFNARNVVRIANPITIELGEPSPLKDKRFLAVGRLVAQKGFDMLLDAWALARCRNEGWKLCIVGSGDLEREHRKQIERLGIGNSVEILPPTKDVQKMYREASAYVLSSRFEGLPLVLIEATAMGLPVVSFDCDYGPRDIIVHGETGVLVPPEDVAALAAAMDGMAADEEKRARMGAAALERRSLFSLETIMSQWFDLLKQY